MATQFSMLGIINAALLAQGQEEISANDGSLEWRTLSRNWPAIVEAEFEDGGYFFTKTEATLHSRTDGKFGFEDAYLVPADALHVRSVWLVENGQRFETDWLQDGSHVHLNGGSGCLIEYVTSQDSHIWSANFVRGVQLRLEALVLRGPKEEHAEADRTDERAEVAFQRARTISSKTGTPKPAFKKGPIARARSGRG